MTELKRGEGRDALVQATVDLLREGHAIQVKEVAARAGVSHTLIYRHFPDGGKEELIAEAYAELFKGLVLEDMDELLTLVENGAIDRERLRAYGMRLLSPGRDEVRGLRLDALAQVRLNPYLAPRIGRARQDLVAGVAEAFVQVVPHLPKATAIAIAVLHQGVPLGVTAIGGASMSRATREAVADMWADSFLALLDRVR